MRGAKITERHTPFSVPPDVTSPQGELEAWFTSPPGAVVQMVAPLAGTAAMARWLVGEARERLFARFPGEAALILVLDLSLMTTRDSAVRAILSEAAKELRSSIAHSVLVPPSNGGAIYLKSLEVSVLLLRGFGVNIEVSKSLASTVTSLGLSPAAKSRAPQASNASSK